MRDRAVPAAAKRTRASAVHYRCAVALPVFPDLPELNRPYTRRAAARRDIYQGCDYQWRRRHVFRRFSLRHNQWHGLQGSRNTRQHCVSYRGVSIRSETGPESPSEIIADVLKTSIQARNPSTNFFTPSNQEVLRGDWREPCSFWIV